jgi:hypothetical protein
MGRDAAKLGLPNAPFDDVEVDRAFGHLCEVLAQRDRVNEFRQRQAVLAPKVLAAHDAAAGPPPHLSAYDGDVEEWIEWLRRFPELTPADSALLRYLRGVAQRLDREAIDNAEAQIERVPLAALRSGERPAGQPRRAPFNGVMVVGVPLSGKPRRRSLLAVSVSVDTDDGWLAWPDAAQVTLYHDALLDENGELLIDADEEALADIEAPLLAADWPSAMAELEARWHRAFGGPWHETTWGPGGAALIADLLDANDIRPTGLVQAYDSLAAGRLPPLIEQVLDGAVPEAADPLSSDGFFGHMDEAGPDGRVAFALDATQRMATVAATRAAWRDAIAVTPINGPPGTGKTSVLRAIIASHWVQDALSGRDVPRQIWGTGCTNKAVRNMIEAFGAVAGPAGSGLHARWIDGLPSYGWFSPSIGATSESQHLMLLVLDKGSVKAAGAASEFQAVGQGGAEAATDAFMQRATPVLGPACVSLPSAAELLLGRIRAGVARIQSAESALKNTYATLRHASATWRGATHARWVTAQRAVARADAKCADARARRERATAAIARVDAWQSARRVGDWRRRLPGWLVRWAWPGIDDAERTARAAAVGAVLGESLPAATDDDLVSALHHLHATAGELAAWLDRTKGPYAQLVQAAFAEASRRDARRAAGRDWLALTGHVGPPTRSQLRALRRLERSEEPFVEWWNALQSRLDREERFTLFHLAARFWEARYLMRWQAGGEMGLAACFMLAPVMVVTTARFVWMARETSPQVVVMDETGQCSPHEGVVLLRGARQAICVGDVEQLQPVKALDQRASQAIAAQAGLEPGLLPEALSSDRGSMMRTAQRASAVQDGGRHRGVTLRYHYRCAPAIIGYCNHLSYAGAIIAVRPEDAPEEPLAGRRMTWVHVAGTPHQVGSSWQNAAEADEIARWLAASHEELVASYGKPLEQVVAILTPLKSQAILIRGRVRAALKGRGVADETINALVIGTVHALQGDERHVVVFSLTQTGSSLFAERRGNNLMNVAVSRAKDEFIVFADRRTLRPTSADGQLQGTGSIASLGRYLRAHGARRYPHHLVVIEAHGKHRAVEAALGLDVAVVATGGTVQQIENVDDRGQIHWTPFPAALAAELASFSDLPELVLATDDDFAGEIIGWHVARAVAAAGGRQRVSRMRFHSLELDDLLRSFAARGDRFDAALLRAALTRAVAQQDIQRQERTMGSRVSLPQRGLLELVERCERDLHWQVMVRLVNASGRTISGFVAESDASLALPCRFASREEAERAAQRVTAGVDVVFHDVGVGITQRATPYPANTTFRVLAMAADELAMPPWHTQEHLNAMYLEGARR